MKKILLFLTIALTFGPLAAQNKSPWQKVDGAKITDLQKVKTTTYSENQQLFQLDEAAFKQSLSNAKYKATGEKGVEISLPNVNGELEKFMVWETSSLAPELQAKFPEIKSYVGRGIADPTAYLAFSVAPIGVQTMILRAGNSEFIEAYTKDHSTYVLFDSKTRNSEKLPFTCTSDAHAANEIIKNTGETLRANNQVFKTFRLAISCTGEYATYYGGTVAGALAGMNATMTRVNGVYDRDLAVKLVIIPNNDLVIYTNAATDPYSNATVGTAQANANNANGWNIQLQNTLTNVLGNAAYDIGHIFGASGGGGNAGCIGCVCVDDTASTTDKNKGSGFTSPSNNAPVGDTFDIDYVAHEMGHQLGGTHTFSYGVESAGTNIEPGSGSTIMAYAGVADPASLNVQSNSDAFFAYKSIAQIQTNLESKTCSVDTPLTNSPPVVSAGSNFTIPFSTAFVLKGTATDPDGDAMTYIWEENDNANSTVTGLNSVPSPTKTVGPNFRTYQPTTSLDRYMPLLSTVLSGSLSNGWEAISNQEGARSLNFNFTARDNAIGAGQTGRDASLVVVSSSVGPFELTSQNTSGISWTSGSTETITWNVNGTTALVGSANVNIKLSTDGGLTFPTVLAANIPNNGSTTITVPSITPAQSCRLWIEPTGNIYYAVNAKSFSIGYDCNVSSITPNVAIPDGAGSNTAGTTLTSTIDVTDVGTVSNMKVTLNIAHPYIGDLVIKLKHPDGTERTLWNRTCNSAGPTSGINVTLVDGAPTVVCASPTTGTYRSNQTLASFNGKPTNGAWTLSIQDFFNGDEGNLVSWGVDFGCTLGNNEVVQNADFSIFPNPNKGNFTLQFNNDAASDVNVTVHDLRGRKIFESKYNNTGLFYQNIQLNRAETGIYLVTVEAGDKKMVKKIVVE